MVNSASNSPKIYTDAMKNFKRIAENIQIQEILSETAKNENLFVEIPWTLKPWQLAYTHRGLQIMMLRNNPAPLDVIDDPESYKRYSDELICNDLECYRLFPETRRLVYAVLEAVQGSHIGRLGIAKLPPGGKIHDHIDTGLSSDYYSRYHVMLNGEPDNWANCGNEWVEMLTGECWTFNHHLMHSFENRSESSRIYLNLDIA